MFVVCFYEVCLNVLEEFGCEGVVCYGWVGV